MADIIELSQRSRELSNLITAAPVEFRRGDWEGGYGMLCAREESGRYEAHRQEALRRPNHQHIGFVPEHVTLADGYHYTLLGLFRHRRDEVLMRRVYRLAGLMECVVNAPSAVLRSDLLRRFYQSIVAEREALNVVWRGDVAHFFLPLGTDLYPPVRFLNEVARARSLKDLYDIIASEAKVQFDLLVRHYVIYLPRALAGGS